MDGTGELVMALATGELNQKRLDEGDQDTKRRSGGRRATADTLAAVANPPSPACARGSRSVRDSPMLAPRFIKLYHRARSAELCRLHFGYSEFGLAGRKKARTFGRQ